VGGGGDGADIQAEAIKGQGRPPPQAHQMGGGIHTHNLCPHKRHIGERTEAPQVEQAAGGILQAGQDRRHKARIAEGAVTADQGEARGGRAQMGAHQPPPQHQGMGVTATGQDQVVAPGTGIHAADSGGDTAIQ
jgi:hypothetical protein